MLRMRICLMILWACIAFLADARPAAAESEGPHASQTDLDAVYTLEHFVPVGPGRKVHMTEKFTLRSWLRYPRRAVLMLPGPIVKASFYDLHTDGYSFQSDLAQAGFFAFAIDYEGSGESTSPPDGRSVTHEFLVDEGRRVLEAVRRLRGVARVDVHGQSIGGAVASELCEDATRTRTCVLSSMLYRTPSEFFKKVFLDPAFIAFLEGQPNGYLPTTPSFYSINIVTRSPAPVADEILATQPGPYPVMTVLRPAYGLPWFDPTRAKVPGLIVQGTLDTIPAATDPEDLRAAYGTRGGGNAKLVWISGGGHIPLIENAPFHIEYKTAVLDFLDSH
ncbi:alpha/beta fold hydrolase [Pendulispora brunnea]|uniref:Alpha/beta fold hydrolase n=1 Tax=Pendulispora brunnea TaxID=2905690 RepID=A0ABZ2K712_9BACT